MTRYRWSGLAGAAYGIVERLGERHLPHGVYPRRTASDSVIGILETRTELQVPRWYRWPVVVM